MPAVWILSVTRSPEGGELNGSKLSGLGPGVVEPKCATSKSRGIKNVTPHLREDLTLWVRLRAAEENRRVSAWLGERIAEMKRHENQYQIALERYLSMKPLRLKGPGVSYPDRKSLHDRAGLR